MTLRRSETFHIERCWKVIVLQNYLVLVFVGYCTNIARYVAKWGIAQQMCLCETKYQGAVSCHVGELLNSWKSITQYGVSQHGITISHDMGPIRMREQHPQDDMHTSSLSELSSEVSKRGWRTERVGARKSSYARDSGIFLHPFSYSSLGGRWTQFWGTILLHLGRCQSPTPPDNPFSKPLIYGGGEGKVKKLNMVLWW